jgi:hypothetical protein
MHVISTEAVRLHRAAQWRDPCIFHLLGEPSMPKDAHRIPANAGSSDLS